MKFLKTIQISKATLTRYPYHKSSRCPKCDKWWAKAKNYSKCPDCNVQLKSWPKTALNKAKYKKMLKDNVSQRKRTVKYKQKNRERISNYNKKYYQEHKEELKPKKNYSALLRASRKWKAKNKDRIKVYRKKYYNEVEKPKRSNANSQIEETKVNQ